MSSPVNTAQRDRMNWSPAPEGSKKASCFRHNPYSTHDVLLFGYDAMAQLQQPAVMTANVLPPNTRHVQLWGAVSFVQFPSEAFVPPMDAMPMPNEPLQRVFLGQLPYFVTEMELTWMTYVLGGGQAVVYPERIMKRQACGERLPTGCIHAWATADAISIMAANMHKRMLVDDTGVWYAQSDEEVHTLAAYVSEMKSDKSKRIPGRPYDTIVVQEAMSNFVPACPVPLTEFPTERPQRQSPPPPYAAPTTYHA